MGPLFDVGSLVRNFQCVGAKDLQSIRTGPSVFILKTKEPQKSANLRLLVEILMKLNRSNMN